MNEIGAFSFDLNDDSMAFAIPGLEMDETEETPKDDKLADVGEEEKPSIRVSHRYGHRQLSRKAKSEEALSEALDWHFKPGDCYHCFSFGDVDSLTFFKHVLRQQRVEYLALSTWCMAGEDVDDLRKWHRRGMLGRVDFYVGEIFPGSYPEVYDAVVDFLPEMGGAPGSISQSQQDHGCGGRALRRADRVQRECQYKPAEREHGADRGQRPGEKLYRAAEWNQEF